MTRISAVPAMALLAVRSLPEQQADIRAPYTRDGRTWVHGETAQVNLHLAVDDDVTLAVSGAGGSGQAVRAPISLYVRAVDQEVARRRIRQCRLLG